MLMQTSVVQQSHIKQAVLKGAFGCTWEKYNKPCPHSEEAVLYLYLEVFGVYLRKRVWVRYESKQYF